MAERTIRRHFHDLNKIGTDLLPPSVTMMCPSCDDESALLVNDESENHRTLSLDIFNFGIQIEILFFLAYNTTLSTLDTFGPFFGVSLFRNRS